MSRKLYRRPGGNGGVPRRGSAAEQAAVERDDDRGVLGPGVRVRRWRGRGDRPAGDRARRGRSPGPRSPAPWPRGGRRARIPRRPRRGPDRCSRSPVRRTSSPRAAGSRTPPRASGTARRSRARSTSGAPRRRRSGSHTALPPASSCSRRPVVSSLCGPGWPSTTIRKPGTCATTRSQRSRSIRDVLARREVADDQRERRPVELGHRRGPAVDQAPAEPVGGDDRLRVPERVEVPQPVAGRLARGDEPRRLLERDPVLAGEDEPLRRGRLVRAGDRHHVVHGQDGRQLRPGHEVLGAVDDLGARRGRRAAR